MIEREILPPELLWNVEASGCDYISNYVAVLDIMLSVTRALEN